jgi:hypothetical protein
VITAWEKGKKMFGAKAEAERGGRTAASTDNKKKYKKLRGVRRLMLGTSWGRAAKCPLTGQKRK